MSKVRFIPPVQFCSSRQHLNFFDFFTELVPATGLSKRLWWRVAFSNQRCYTTRFISKKVLSSGAYMQIYGSSGLNFGAILGASSAALTSAASSICCAGPLAITLLGVNGAILGAAIKPYRPFLLTVSGLMLVLAFGLYFRLAANGSGVACSIRAKRLQRSFLWAGVGLWVAALLIGFAADRYWL